jgi:hypothetical protein
MLTATILSAILAGPQRRDYDPFMALGRMRAEFGERHIEIDDTDKSWMDKWIWNMHSMMMEGQTIALFPEGSYDRRIYLQSIDSLGDSWLAYERRNQTPVNGEDISFIWRIKLKAVNDGEPTPPGLGTLELMLRREGLAVPKNLPKEAEYTLKARKGFAAYNIAPGPGFSIFRFWYVNADGSSTKASTYTPPWPEYDDPWPYPDTPFPYPVTDEEKASLTKQGWKLRLPWDK